MKALVWYGDDDLRLVEADDPEPRAGDVVLDVVRAGICGSDLHAYRGHPGPRVPPLILGHEAVLRDGGGTLKVAFPLIGCGTCPACRRGEVNLCPTWQLIGMHRPGVFAEKVALPPSCVLDLPAGMSELEAVLAEPLACAIGAIAPHGVGPETRVAVLGAGPIGLLAGYACRRAGASVVIADPVPERLEIASAIGVGEQRLDAHDLAPGEADVVIDAAGVPDTWIAGLAAARTGGDVVMIGLGAAVGEFPMAALVRRSIRLRGQFAYSRRDFEQAIAVLAEGDLPLGWLSEMPLRDGREGFARLVGEPQRNVKITLTTA